MNKHLYISLLLTYISCQEQYSFKTVKNDVGKYYGGG